MALASGVYAGEISEAWAAPREGWRRRRAAMLLVDLDELAGLRRRLKLASRAQVEAELARAGLPRGGPVQALWTPRFCAYLCHGADGALAAIRYVIGDRVCLTPAGGEAGMARLYAGEAGGRTYALGLRPAGETAQIVLDATDPHRGFAFAATFLARRRPLTRWGVLSARLSRFGGLAAGLAEILAAWRPAAAPAERRLAA